MTLSEELMQRGFIYQTTADAVGTIVDDEKRVIYHGIDPSADSAHAGNLVIWLLLRHLAMHGHRIIFLVGGGTGLIGDPKPDAERELRAETQVDSNVSKIKAQAERLIGQGSSITFVNNKDWLGSLSLLQFLRDIGKHFTVNELIKKDAIAKRVASDTGISYTEFAYPLLQGYDYLVLNEQYDCTVQVGGSDQWGNIIAGVDLIRRKTGKTTHAITVPLIVDKATGKKFGKSEGNAIWLDEEKTSPYAFYQFWLNTSDENVADYLRLFTFIPLAEIEQLLKEHRAAPERREAQRRLAEAITTFVHGAEGAAAVAKVSAVLFQNGGLETITTPTERTLLLANAPAYHLSTAMPIVDLLLATNLAASKREAREFIANRAVELAGEVVEDEATTISPTDTLRLLRRGKKHIVVLH